MKWLLLPLALLLPAAPVLADGKFYVREEVPPGVPYQRAIIAFDGEKELLVLQSKYEVNFAKRHGKRSGQL